MYTGTLREAQQRISFLIEKLGEFVFDLPDPADFKHAQELWTKLQKIPMELKIADSEGFETPIRSAIIWTQELEKMFAGQRALFASTTLPGGTRLPPSNLRSASAEASAIVDDLLEILMEYDEIVQREQISLRRQIMGPPRTPPAQRGTSRGPRAPKTYAQAQLEIMDLLKKKGWRVVGNLKVPHATDPTGQYRVWFKAQAIYATVGSTHNMGKARSLWMDDIRMMSADEAVKDILRALQSRR